MLIIQMCFARLGGSSLMDGDTVSYIENLWLSCLKFVKKNIHEFSEKFYDA